MTFLHDLHAQHAQHACIQMIYMLRTHINQTLSKTNQQNDQHA